MSKSDDAINALAELISEYRLRPPFRLLSAEDTRPGDLVLTVAYGAESEPRASVEAIGAEGSEARVHYSDGTSDKAAEVDVYLIWRADG